MLRRTLAAALPLVALGVLVCALRPTVVLAPAPDYTIANGTPNTTAKFTAIATLANGWAMDDGTTWGVASKFTITEANGNVRAFGTGTIDGAFVGSSTGSFGGTLNMNAHLITNVTDPVSSQDAVTLAYANSHYSATGGVTSSTLTANTIPVATGAAAIGNSLLTDNATTLAYATNKFTVVAANGNTAIAGTAGITGLATLTGGFTLGVDSSANSHKITSLTNGSSAQDAAAFGQLATAVNAAVSGTTNTIGKFTGTNVVGNSLLTDDATTLAYNTNKFSVVAASGNTLIAGTAGITGLATLTAGFTIGADSSANTHKITSLTNGSSAQDAAAFGQIATAVNTAVVGTANTTTKFTGTNTVGNAWALDDGTTWGVTAKFTITEANGNFATTGNTTLGDAAADTVTVNATTTFANPVTTQAISKTSISPTAITGAVNNWAPTSIGTAEVIYVATTADAVLSGIVSTSCTNGRVLTFVNTSTHNVKFLHASGLSTRPFHNSGGFDWVLYNSTDLGAANEVGAITYRCSTITNSWEMISASSSHLPVLKVEGFVDVVGAITLLTTQPLSLQANSHMISTNATTSIACNGTGAAATCLSTCSDLAGTITTNTAATTCTVTFGQTYGTNLQSCNVSTGTAVATPAYISARSATAFTITFPALTAGIVDYICTGH